MPSFSLERIWIVMLVLAVILPFLVGHFARHRIKYSLLTTILFSSSVGVIIVWLQGELATLWYLNLFQSLRLGRAVTVTGAPIEHPEFSHLLLVLAIASSFAWAIHAKHLERSRSEFAT